jgi:hypothetical protein
MACQIPTAEEMPIKAISRAVPMQCCVLAIYLIAGLHCDDIVLEIIWQQFASPGNTDILLSGAALIASREMKIQLIIKDQWLMVMVDAGRLTAGYDGRGER